jgi:hypothetical protein
MTTPRRPVPAPAELPVWLSSSAHARPHRPGDPARRPYGTQHARRVGETRTACGENALEWPYFWDLPFGSEPDACCLACVAAVRTVRSLYAVPTGPPAPPALTDRAPRPPLRRFG